MLIGENLFLMSEEGFKKIMVFLSTDVHPSPFDVLFAYDTGVDAVVYYGGVTAETAGSLILDTMFPRGPEGLKYTVVFIGGKNYDECLKIAEVAKKTYFKPFVASTIVDPAGAFTTSSAVVVKVSSCLKAKGFDPAKAKYTVLGGAGRVGRCIAYLLAKLGATVVIGDVLVEGAKERAREINEKVGAERAIAFEKATDKPENVLEACKDSTVVITAGPPAKTLLPLDVLTKLESCVLVADINATPPYGVEGIKPTYDCKAMKKLPRVTAIGALAIGSFRNKVQRALIRKAFETPGAFFGLDEAFEVARSLVS